MNMAIPNSFTVANREWSVRYGTDLKRRVDGETRYESAEVVIRPGKNKKYMEHVFLHELMHVLANAIGDEKMNADEGKIDALAGLLHQFLQTKKGNLNNAKVG